MKPVSLAIAAGSALAAIVIWNAASMIVRQEGTIGTSLATLGMCALVGFFLWRGLTPD